MVNADRLYRDLFRRDRIPTRLRPVLRYLAILSRKMDRDAIYVRAGTLSYWSLVALVPAAVLTVLVLRALDLESWFSISTFAGRALVAILPGWDVVGLPAEVDAAKIGVVGLVTAFAASTRIFLSAEEAYNRIFDSRARKPITSRLALYYLTLTIAPAITAFGFSITAAATRTHQLDRVMPFLVTLGAFAFAIRAIPDATIRWRSALLGGLVSAVGFELAKWGFAAYITVFKSAGAAKLIYGSLAFVPVLLLWVFVVWVIVLVGVEVACVDDRWPELARAEDRLLSGTEHRVPDAFFGLQVVLAIVDHTRRGLGPAPEPSLGVALGSDPEHVAAALRTLETAALVARTETGFLLTVPADLTSGTQVLARYQDVSRPPTDEGAQGSSFAATAFAAPPLDRPLNELVGA